MKETLKKIEETWIEIASRAITESEDTNLYAAAFWLIYCDYTMLGVPCFALNPEGHSSAKDDDTRWAPPEWKTDVHDCVEKIQPLYTEISEEMEGKSDEDWEELMNSHYNLLFRVCKKITNSYHSDESIFQGSDNNSDFIVGILEEREGDEMYEWLLKNSIDPDNYSKAKGLTI